MLNDDAKFAGECSLEIVNGVSQFYDATIVGYNPESIGEISFDWEIVDCLKEDESFPTLEDGLYHVYFEGELEFDKSFSIEWGTEYDMYSHLNYINFERMRD